MAKYLVCGVAEQKVVVSFGLLVPPPTNFERPQ